MSIDLFFRTIELEMEAARVKREKREAEVKAAADAIAAAADLRREVNQLKKSEAQQIAKIAALVKVAEKPPRRQVIRIVQVVERDSYCPLDAALENDTYE